MTNSHREIRRKGLDQIFTRQKSLEMPGIDPGTSRMLSGRSTIWATPPWWRDILVQSYSSRLSLVMQVCAWVEKGTNIIMGTFI